MKKIMAFAFHKLVFGFFICAFIILAGGLASASIIGDLNGVHIQDTLKTLIGSQNANIYIDGNFDCSVSSSDDNFQVSDSAYTNPSVNVYSSSSALEKIIASNTPTTTALNEYRAGNIQLEANGFLNEMRLDSVIAGAQAYICVFEGNCGSSNSDNSESNNGGCNIIKWNCDAWSACLDGNQARICTSNCNTQKTETQTCINLTPDVTKNPVSLNSLITGAVSGNDFIFDLTLIFGFSAIIVVCCFLMYSIGRIHKKQPLVRKLT